MFDFLVPRFGSSNVMQQAIRGIAPPRPAPAGPKRVSPADPRPNRGAPAPRSSNKDAYDHMHSRAHALPAPMPSASNRSSSKDAYDTLRQRAVAAVTPSNAARNTETAAVLPNPNLYVPGGDFGYYQPQKGGKFLRKAYSAYYNGRLVGPIPGEEYARAQFKKSHKWARANTSQSNRDLEMAVRYLMMKPTTAPRYYNP